MLMVLSAIQAQIQQQSAQFFVYIISLTEPYGFQYTSLLIKECLEDLGLSVAEAAQGLGVTRQQLHKVVAQKSSVTPEMAFRLEKAFGGVADTWLKCVAVLRLSL